MNIRYEKNEKYEEKRYGNINKMMLDKERIEVSRKMELYNDITPISAERRLSEICINGDKNNILGNILTYIVKSKLDKYAIFAEVNGREEIKRGIENYIKRGKEIVKRTSLGYKCEELKAIIEEMNKGEENIVERIIPILKGIYEQRNIDYYQVIQYVYGYASVKGYPSVIELMLKQKLDVSDGGTNDSLYNAIYSGNIECYLMISRDSRINIDMTIGKLLRLSNKKKTVENKMIMKDLLSRYPIKYAMRCIKLCPEYSRLEIMKNIGKEMIKKLLAK